MSTKGRILGIHIGSKSKKKSNDTDNRDQVKTKHQWFYFYFQMHNLKSFHCTTTLNMLIISINIVREDKLCKKLNWYLKNYDILGGWHPALSRQDNNKNPYPLMMHEFELNTWLNKIINHDVTHIRTEIYNRHLTGLHLLS